MNTKVNSILKAKLDRLHQSPKYRSFFNDAVIDAFSKVEASAFAGKSIKASPRDDLAPRC
ncbi:hypothetical protein [Pseudomonas pudica]|uniref:Uncharacterized protein n=1 Tax=Pseudomonas pudica TaxID=272772 RepID=A0ABS0FUJ8_9PSED|nr:hypothetical protein [Pseudomonas pudica]MBF8644041.1 hypothetical protein [Pseudomonas pudica]MBF8758592.1 hypothetical protein [Pseudomonas pudica]